MFRSIKNKLIFLFLIAILTPLLVMRLIAYPTAQKAIQETTISDLQTIGSKKVSRVNDWLHKLKDNAEHFSNSPLVLTAANLSKIDGDFVSQLISHISGEDGVRNVIVADSAGVIRLSTEVQLIGLNVSRYEGFEKAVGGVTSVNDVTPFSQQNLFGLQSQDTETHSIFVSAPVKDDNGNTVGALLLQNDLSGLAREWEETHYGDGYYVYAVDRHGKMVSTSDFGELSLSANGFKGKNKSGAAVVEPQTNNLTKGVISCLGGDSGFDMNGYTNHLGKKVLGVWYWMPELKWGVVAEIDVDKLSLAMNNFKNPFIKILSYLTVAGVIMAVAGIAFAFLIGQKIANPIMELIAATRRMSAGDLSQRVTINAKDEVSELGGAFNIMAESVREKTSKLQETSNFLNSILISSTEHSIIAGDFEGNILAFNEGARRMYGYEPAEMINKSNIQMLHTKEDIASGKVKKILETIQSAGRYKNEMRLVRKTGEVFTGYSTFTTRQSVSSEPIGFVMITRDITEQKLLERELHNYTVQLEKIVEERTRKLRASEEKYRRLFETSKDVVFFCDTDCQIIDINQAGVDLFGYESKGDILKLNLAGHLFFSPDEGIIIKEMVCKNGFIKNYEVELKRKDGVRVPCLMTSNLRRDERNNIIGYEGIIIDQTERKRIEQEKDIINNINKLLASKLDIREVYKSLNAELNKIIDFDRMSITILDEKRDEFLIFAVSKDYYSSKLEEGVHYSKYGTLAGKVVEEGGIYMVNDTSLGSYSTDPILLKEGIKSRLAFPLICKGEIIGSVNFGSKKVNNFSESQFDIINKIAPQLSIAIDNTRLFDKIKESEEKYRNLVEDIDDIIFRMDKTGRYLFLNKAFQTVTGYSPKEFYENSSLAAEMIDKNDLKMVNETIQKILCGELKVSKDLEYKIYRKNGDELWVSQNTYPIKNKNGSITGIEGIIRDITDRKKIEEQIRRSERLASIGELAASIAHEIRNPLGAISNSVCMLKRDLSLRGDDQKLFEMVVEETDRLNSIITNFLTFAHPAEYHFVRSELVKIIDETLFLLEQDARYHDKIKVVKIYEKNIPKIYLDRNWIRKVFWNLLVNSIDAMPGGGKIIVRVRRPKFPMSDNDQVEVVIADTGKGIPPEIKKKIFEPFFTTKKSKGTGLGLSIVHRIVDNHGGIIDVKSKPNKWTVFTITLPIKNKRIKTVSSV